MKFGRKSEIAVNPLSYNLGIIGESGIGKSSTIAEYCRTLAGDDGFMFLNMGHEDGLSGIADVPYVNCVDWDSDYDEDLNSIGFSTFVDDIVENRTSDWQNLKVVVIDTLDELFAIVEPYVIRLHNKENPNKKVKSIKAAFGGYMAGEDMADELVVDRLWALKHVGVSFIIIGHTKMRNKIDQSTGEEYSQLTTNLSQRHFDTIKNKLDVIGVAHVDRTIVREKANEKAKTTGKDGKKGVIRGESRIITFRDDDYSIDSKSRLEHICHTCPLNANSLIEAMKDAIRKKIESGNTSFEETEKKQNKQAEERMNRISKEESAAKSQANVDAAIQQISQFFIENKSNLSAVKPILMAVKEMGYDNPAQIDNMDDAKKILDMMYN